MKSLPHVLSGTCISVNEFTQVHVLGSTCIKYKIDEIFLGLCEKKSIKKLNFF